MVEALPLGQQVAEVVLARRYQQRHLLGDLDAVAQQRLTLARVVRQQPYGPYAEVVQHLRRHPVVAGVHRQPEGDVRLDGVEPLRLELHRLQLGEQSDAPALVTPEVDKDAAALGDDGAQRVDELGAALAVLRSEGVAREAFGMQPGEHVPFPESVQVAVDEDDLFLATVVVEVADGMEIAVLGGQWGNHDSFDTCEVGIPAEYAKVICHDLVPKQSRKGREKHE